MKGEEIKQMRTQQLIIKMNSFETKNKDVLNKVGGERIEVKNQIIEVDNKLNLITTKDNTLVIDKMIIEVESKLLENESEMRGTKRNLKRY